ncbi:competence protein CoiA family protein [Alkalihalobacillus macyae]|uniref:competence protein CoiA n=1 Tax=Guptibacillus hwajinpoensis TaxID=208199 RepID=UPI00273B3A71|nr:competence protein CoiA family protein [Alkalihalobacillus macyae]MDP4550800.1 competence protein CoiA family protein [Alkalihalobacillus macyae]
MLTAHLKDGTLFNLADPTHVLKDLRKLRNLQYFCPTCKERVIMKLGEKRVWHFSHHVSDYCIGNWERESNYHLSGKKQLYEWVKKENLDVKLEYYLNSSKQRPDLLLPSRRIAIEYQCSSIDDRTLRQRTTDYDSLGYDVRWIFGAVRYKSKYRSIQSISAMEWSAVHYANGNPMLTYYCPEQQKFAFVTIFYTLTPTKTVCSTSYYPSSSLTLSNLLDFPPKSVNSIDHTSIWLKQKRIWRQNPHGEKSFAYFYLRKLLYSKGHNIRMFPCEAGIPSPYNFWLSTPPYLWQTWVLVCFLPTISIGNQFTFDTILRSFQRVISINLIQVRTSIGEKRSSEALALKGYLNQLIRLKVVKERDNERYEKLCQPQMNRDIDRCYELDLAILRRLQ